MRNLLTSLTVAGIIAVCALLIMFFVGGCSPAGPDSRDLFDTLARRGQHNDGR